eukprot:m.261564 g.261564  ORF g.261564 m.261564 type:complete len:185 (+) comp17600_c1_seq1:129-683(+)
MEVLDESSALLSSYEVLSVVEQQLQQSKAMQTRRPNPGQENLHTVLFEVKQYLQYMPCRNQSEDAIQAFLEEMKQYPLLKAERLQLLDTRPTSEVSLMLLIEECDKRFDEDQREAILASVRKTLPPGPGQESEAEEETQGEDEVIDEQADDEPMDDDDDDVEGEAEEDELVAEGRGAVVEDDDE